MLYPGDISFPEAEYDEFFYDPCDRCDKEDARLRDQPETRLCLPCQHLRLQHLFYCTTQMERFRRMLIRLETMKVIQDRVETCEFCKFLYSAAYIKSEAGKYLIDSEVIEKDPDRTVAIHRYRDRGDKNFSTDIYFLKLAIRLEVFTPSADPSLRHSQCNDKEVELNVAGPEVDWKKVRSWLAECESQHNHKESRASNPTDSLPQDFAVIDTDKGCIIAAPPDCKYIALSYVWGLQRHGELMATRSSLEFLKTPGNLTKDTLPATIWDAMKVCQELAVPFLWVDRLCIVQDDNTKKDHIRAMDIIYSRAVVTVCAAGSPDAQSGLFGTSATPRPVTQAHFKIGSVEVVAHLPDDRSWRLGHNWWRRGWTYQEYLLSERKLLFTPWQVVFECDHRSQFEGYPDWGTMPTLESQARSSTSSCLERYKWVLEEYNDRVFSWPDDIYDAFQGVFKSIYGNLDQFVWALPAADFEAALLWTTESLSPPWRGTPRVATRGVHLATWSWVAAAGRTTIYSGVNTENIASVAQWNFWSEERGLQPILSGGTAEKCHDFTSAIHAWSAWVSGCISASLTEELALQNSMSLAAISEQLSTRWPTCRDYRREAFLTPGPWLCDDQAQIALLKEKTGRVLVRTTVNTFRADSLEVNSRFIFLRALDGKIAGELERNSLPPIAHSSFSSSLTDQRDWEFIALSAGEMPYSHYLLEILKRDTSAAQSCNFRPLPEKRQ